METSSAKRRRISSESTPSSMPASPSPAPAQPPPPPQMSAVAARRAAADALSLARAADPIITPRDEYEAAQEMEFDSEGSVVNSEEEEEEDEVEKEEGLQSSAAAKRAKRIALRGKKKDVRAGRYFMPQEEEKVVGEDGMQMEVEEPEVGLNGLEARNDGHGIEEVKEAPKVKIKLGRGKRQRKERSAFLDPYCSSTFSPISNENIFQVNWVESEGTRRQGWVCCFATGETLIIHGTYLLTPLLGSVSIHGTSLFPSPTSPSHRIFAPSSHPLPILISNQLPFQPSSSSTSTLILPNAQTINIESYSSVVMIEGLACGIEGVEKVMRGGGFGGAEGMWEMTDELSLKGNYGGEGYKFILESTPSLTSVRALVSWESALSSFDLSPSFSKNSSDEISVEETGKGAERMVLLIEGPKRVGKSTFAKYLTNRLLERYEKVAFLDTDLGQPEFSPPGLVSLTVLDRPVFGPSFTHLSIPIASHFLGTLSPASDPAAYSAAISSLIATYGLEVEYPLVDDYTPRNRGHATTSSEAPMRKIRDRVPLVVNTQGWVKGLGKDLLARLKEEIRPTHFFAFENLDDMNEGGGGGTGEYLGGEYQQSDARQIVFNLESAPSSPLDSKWSAADLRTLSFISYFHSIFLSSESTTTRLINTFPTRWDFSLPLVEKTPYAISWTDSKELQAVHILHDEIDYANILHALNGSIVGITTLTSSNESSETTSSQSNTGAHFPYTPNSVPPHPSTSNCQGLAIIRSIDPLTHSLLLLTPLPCPSRAIILIKGALELPLPLMMDYSNVNGGEGAMGVAGWEWKDVPFLSVEEGEGGRKKVRRNLMRKGQN